MRNIFRNTSVLKYLSTLMILCVLLLPKFPLINVPGTFVAIRLEDVVVFLTTFVFIFYLLFDFKQMIEYRVTKYVLLYLVTGVVSVLSAIIITKTIETHIGVLHYVRRIEYFLPMFIALYLVIKDKSNLQYFIKVLVLVTIYIFIYGAGQRYLGWPIIITQNLEYSKGVSLLWIEGSHINSTFAGHYDLAAFLVLILPLVVTVFTVVKQKSSKAILFIASIGGLWLLGYAASRISIVAYMFSVTLALVFIKKYKFVIPVLLVSILIFSLSSNLRYRYEKFFWVLRNRITTSIEQSIDIYASNEFIPEKRETILPTPTSVPVLEDRSTSIRLKASWPKAFRAIEKNPLLGTGYSSITLAVDNNYLRVLGEEGILGFMAWTLVFVGIARSFIDIFPFSKNLKSIDLLYISSMAASTLGIFIIALFIDIFLASKFAIVFWFCIGMALGVIKNEGKEI